MPGGIPELGVVGGRCEVGEAGELWDVVATIYRLQAGTAIWQSDASWPCYLNVQCDGKRMPIGAIKLVPENVP